jgi:hypothetical protein
MNSHSLQRDGVCVSDDRAASLHFREHNEEMNGFSNVNVISVRCQL